MNWDVVYGKMLLPAQNMEEDYCRLLSLTDQCKPTIRFYQWERGSATYGYFLKPEDFLNEEEILFLARRPTGGGIIFHDFDLSFSLLIPAKHPNFSLNTLENYSFVNHCLMKGLKQFAPSLPFQLFCEKGECKPHFCMARSTIYDISVFGKKVAGGAIRKTNRGFLHQGSICLKLPDEDFLKKVLKKKSYREEIYSHSYPLLENCSAIEGEKDYLMHCLVQGFL